MVCRFNSLIASYDKLNVAHNELIGNLQNIANEVLPSKNQMINQLEDTVNNLNLDLKQQTDVIKQINSVNKSLTSRLESLKQRFDEKRNEVKQLKKTLEEEGVNVKKPVRKIAIFSLNKSMPLYFFSFEIISFILSQNCYFHSK